MFEPILDWLRTRRDPLRGEDSAARWVETVSTHDMFEIQKRVVDLVARYPSMRKSVLPDHVEALLKVDERIDPIATQLVSHYVEEHAVSADVEQRLWLGAFEVTRVFLAAYLHSFKFASQSGDKRWRTLLPLLAVRHAMWKYLDAKLRLFRYSRWTPAQWREMHYLYEFARARRWHQRRAVFGDLPDARELPSLEESYLRTLLLMRMDSGNFTPDQVAWVAGRLDQWTAGLALDSKRREHQIFYVDASGTSGLKRVGRQLPTGRVFYVDTSGLVEQIDGRLRDLTVPAAGQEAAEGELPANEQRLVLQKLATLYASEDRATIPRAARETVDQRVPVVVGFPAVLAAVAAAERMLEQGAGETPEHPTTLGGRLSGLGDGWRLTERSRTGVRLIAPLTATARLGDLVAMGEHGEWKVGLVRRMLRLETDEIMYGVELVGHRVVGVKVRSAQVGAGAQSEAIYLPAHPENRDPQQKALVVAEGLGQQGLTVDLAYGSERYILRLGARVEARSGWSLSAIDSASTA